MKDNSSLLFLFIRCLLPLLLAVPFQQAAAQVDLPDIVATAIHLQQANAWESNAGESARKRYADSPDALRYIEGLRLLLSGDTTGLKRFFDGTPPDYHAWGEAVNTLDNAGFPLAADAFAAMKLTGEVAFGWQDPKVLQDGIRRWMHIPKDKRQPVDEMMWKRLSDNPRRCRDVFELAVDAALYRSSPNSVPSQEDYINLAILVGRPWGAIDYNRIFGMESYPVYAAFSQVIFEDNATNFPVIFQLIERDQQTVDLSLVLSHLQQALKTFTGPDARRLRIEYVETMRAGKYRTKIKPDGLIDPEALTEDADHLLAADALLVQGRVPEAAIVYRQILHDPQQPVQAKLAAWCGLLDTVPTDALQQGAFPMEALAALPAVERAELAVSTIRAIWTNVAPALKVNTRGYQKPWERHRKPLNEAGDWGEPLGEITERLVAMASPETPGVGPYPIMAIRHPAAVILACGGWSEAALAVITYKVEYQQPPPRMGWRGPMGELAPDHDQPRTFVSPKKGEAAKIIEQMIDQVGNAPNADKIMPRIAATLLYFLVPADKTQAEDMYNEKLWTSLDPLVSKALLIATPQPATPGEHPSYEVALAPLAQALHQALQNDDLVRRGYLRSSLSSVLYKRKEPEFLAAVFPLTLMMFDRYYAVRGAKVVDDRVDVLARMMEQNGVVEYAAQLRERYLNK